MDDKGNVLIEQNVETGDIWRMCQTKDLQCVTGWVWQSDGESQLPTVFWLDEYRPHEYELIKRQNLPEGSDLTGTDISIMSPLRGMRFSLERIIRGKSTISVTGNILRDYLTDLFPIMKWYECQNAISCSLDEKWRFV